MTPENQTTHGESTPGLPDATLRALDVGQLIAGRFRLVRPLGKGGMGVVWLATDESLGEEVAFKFLAEILAQDEASLHDLKRELRRTRQLTHHHIIRVHDLVEDPARGVAGITMEVAAGGSLAARRAKTPHGWFEPEEIADWVRQLCEALDYAHRTARVVHRDLKPANLLLDAEGQLKIADFGIAAALHESATRLTQGKISGTPLYMSPEQWQGHPPTPSDDLYALGATLYDLLTGKPPFYSGNIAAAVANLTAPTMTERRHQLEGVDAPLPPEWEQAVAGLLAKTATERPAHADEVAARLSLEGEGPGWNATSGRVPPADATAPTSQADSFAAPATPPQEPPPAETRPEVAFHHRETAAPIPPPAADHPRRGALLAVFAILAVGLGSWFAMPRASDHATATPDVQPALGLRVSSEGNRRPALEGFAPSIGAPASATPTPARPTSAPIPLLRVGSKVIKYRYATALGAPFGYIDTTGKHVVQPKWFEAGPFADGLARVSQDNKWGYIDTSGQLVIPPQWDGAWDFSEGLARVYRDGKASFIDTTGTLVIQPQWDSASDFSEGLSLVKQGGKYGFIDKTGTLVIPPQWDGASPFTSGLTNVKQGDKWGYIDKTGKLVIPLQWDIAYRFSENLARVKRGDKYAFIDTAGTLVIPLQWDDTHYFSEGLAGVRQGDSKTGKWGFIDKSGRLVVQPQWSLPFDFVEGSARVLHDGNYGLIDRTGKVVVPFEWDAADETRIGKNGPVYRHLIRQIAQGKALAVWLGPDLKEIWRAELPLEEKK